MYVIGSSFSCSYEKLMIFFCCFFGDYTFHIVTINNEMIISSLFFFFVTKKRIVNHRWDDMKENFIKMYIRTGRIELNYKNSKNFTIL